MTTTIAAQVEEVKRNESESEKQEMKEGKEGRFRYDETLEVNTTTSNTEKWIIHSTILRGVDKSHSQRDTPMIISNHQIGPHN